MFRRTISPQELSRLYEQKEEAARLYFEILTALDNVGRLKLVDELPHPPPAPDEDQITPINERWKILGDGVSPVGGISRWQGGRLAELLWRLIQPYFERQQSFNAAVVDHINRNLPAERAVHVSAAATLKHLGDRLLVIDHFHTHLMALLQQLTAFVETKERDETAHRRRIDEDLAELIDIVSHRTITLVGAISGVGGELLKRWESLMARERRYEAGVIALAAAFEELRTTQATVQQTVLTVKREAERLRTLERALPAPTGDASETPLRPAVPAPTSAGTADFQQAGAASIDSYKYVGFEDKFRGSPELIRGRQQEYLALFDGASDVADIGCGRGEFLELLRDRGISARGVDLNHEMVEICRSKNLDATEGDALGFLRTQADGSLGGLVALQVVEHLQPDYLLAFLDTAYHKLRPGARIVLETINPACWFAFFASYIRDITHVRPIHPETLSYYVTASGFQKTTVRYSAPYPEHEKLQPVPGGDAASAAINVNVERLNRLLFTYMDYAVVADRL